jgi:hypothetical protein
MTWQDAVASECSPGDGLVPTRHRIAARSGAAAHGGRQGRPRPPAHSPVDRAGRQGCEALAGLGESRRGVRHLRQALAAPSARRPPSRRPWSSRRGPSGLREGRLAGVTIAGLAFACPDRPGGPRRQPPRRWGQARQTAPSRRVLPRRRMPHRHVRLQPGGREGGDQRRQRRQALRWVTGEVGVHLGQSSDQVAGARRAQLVSPASTRSPRSRMKMTVLSPSTQPPITACRIEGGSKSRIPRW